jgi:hypothetical protein
MCAGLIDDNVAGGIARPAIKTILMRSCEASPLFEIALVLVRLNHVATGIVNANHSIM